MTDTQLRAVKVSGMGISCASGHGLKQSLERMLLEPARPSHVTLHEIDTSPEVPVYLIPGLNSLKDVSGTRDVLSQVIEEAIQQSGLTQDERHNLPLFLGSSAFSLDKDVVDIGSPKSSSIGLQQVLAHEQIAEIFHSVSGSSAPYMAFQTACTSSANAIISAARMIELGIHDNAMVLGVELANIPTLAGFSSLQLLAPEIKPFDKNRSGIITGEGIGAIVLSASNRDRPGIHIRSGASNSDPYRVTASNPDGLLVADLQNRMFKRAQIDNTNIVGIKAHGTGSQMNDASEAAVIRNVFSVHPPICALKPYIGHTLGACGVLETILMSAFLQSGVFPATHGFSVPDESLNIIPIATNTDSNYGWYLLNFFGFGGHNTALLMEYVQ